jgi:glycosyltransferase involved in cell wall biosynthesis
MADPLISVVVPVYNYGRYLSQCLDSIFEQNTDYPFEVVAVDDASTDDSLAILNQYKNERLHIIKHTQNAGHGPTIEDGLKATSGRFISRIDPDDRYRPNFFEVTIPKLLEFPEVNLSYGDAALIDDSGQITLQSSDRVHQGADFKGNELVALLEENFICSATVLARRGSWLDALPVPAGLAFHDWYFTVFMARRGDFYYSNEVVADYRVHPQNHHRLIVLDRSEETSLFWLLDKVYSEPEQSHELESQKRAARPKVYSAQHLTLAQKYFGADMYSEARRSYLQAIKQRPGLLKRGDVLRQLAATTIGSTRYERVKRFVKSSNRSGRDRD